jgi:hypothetical protein
VPQARDQRCDVAQLDGGAQRDDLVEARLRTLENDCRPLKKLLAEYGLF